MTKLPHISWLVKQQNSPKIGAILQHDSSRIYAGVSSVVSGVAGSATSSPSFLISSSDICLCIKGKALIVAQTYYID